MFSSSHLLDEIERVADRDTMLNKGKLVLCVATEDIKAQHHMLTLQVTDTLAMASEISGALFRKLPPRGS